MKNLCYLLPCLLLSCSAPLDLSQSVFRTDPKVSSKQTVNQSYKYEFRNGEYSIDYVAAQAIPKTTYRIEEGTYVAEPTRIVLTPSRKLFCSLFQMGHYFDCIGMDPMDDARYIQRDTLPIGLQTKLGFDPRVMPVLRSADLILLVDDAVSESPLALER